MDFDWTEYFHLAQCLQDGEGFEFSKEAARRCAASRAYYAAFCHARNFARDRHGFKPTYTDEDHRLVRKHFRQGSTVAVARRLTTLRQYRNKCDYDDCVPNLHSLVGHAIKSAGEVFADLK